MKYTVERCQKCGGKLSNKRGMTRMELEDEIGKILEIPPTGERANGEKYWSLTGKPILIEMIKKINKLKENKNV
jgi:hypothetical protein